jgi:hypothetical protein
LQTRNSHFLLKIRLPLFYLQAEALNCEWIISLSHLKQIQRIWLFAGRRGPSGTDYGASSTIQLRMNKISPPKLLQLVAKLKTARNEIDLFVGAVREPPDIRALLEAPLPHHLRVHWF